LAQKLGAKVVLTDQEFATGLLKANVGVAGFEDSSCPVVEAFEWGSDVSSLSQSSFDYILISDCINPVYGTDSWEKLAVSIKALSSMDTVTFMSTQLRGGEALAAFLEYSKSFLQSELVFETASEYEDQGKLLVYKIRRAV
jgi:hypothetical protein